MPQQLVRHVLCSFVVVLLLASTTADVSRITIDFAAQPTGTFNASHFSVGQGGFTTSPGWAGHAAAITALRPSTIRVFVQTYYLLPSGAVNFEALDANVALIRATGATPLLTLVFKPASIFGPVNATICLPRTPAGWDAWRALVSTVALRYASKTSSMLYEVLNEPDFGERGGTPFLCNASQYVSLFAATAAALRAADPSCAVGGPATAHYSSPIIPALTSYLAAAGYDPLSTFISWHHYAREPSEFASQTRAVRAAVATAWSALRAEAAPPPVFLDEWGAAGLGGCGGEATPWTPARQAAFLVESIDQLRRANVSRAIHYSIKDVVQRDGMEQCSNFLSAPTCTALRVAWTRAPVCYGLFDELGSPRISYFAARLVARMSGVVHATSPSSAAVQYRNAARSSDAGVRALVTSDAELGIVSILVWGWTANATRMSLTLRHLHDPSNASATSALLRCVELSSVPQPGGVNSALAPLATTEIALPTGSFEVDLAPFGVAYCYSAVVPLA